MARILKNDHLIEQLINDALYQINEDGSIFTFKSGNGSIKPDLRPIRLTRSNGYVGFRYNGKFILLHRIMYRKFIGPLLPGLVINHKDGVRSNNSLTNLELVTDSQNTFHAHKILSRKKANLFGILNGRSKFKKNDVEEIRYKYNNKINNISQLSVAYNVSRITIRNIVRGITYN